MSALAVDSGVGAGVGVDTQEEGTNYPRGGLATSAGGDGMFIDQSGECLKLFVDPRVLSARRIIKAAEAESADISTDHEEPETQILVIHPSSMALFDSYCHPDWYSTKRRREYYQTINGGIEIEGGGVWKRKVMVKESWLDRCLRAGRFLDDWAGCRVGGPPVEKVEPEPEPEADVEMVKELPPDLCIVELPTRSIPASSVSVSVEEGQQDEDISMSDDGRAPLHSIAPVPPSLEKKPVLQELKDPAGNGSDTQGPMGEIVAIQSPAPEGSGQGRKGKISERVDDGSESPEETLASTQPSRKRRRRGGAADMLDTLDVTTLDSGPSPQFASPQPEAEAESSTSPAIQIRASQTPVTPVDDKVFRGLSIFVDLAIKNRSDLLKEIKSAGGQIVGDYSEATHVLVYKYWSNHAKWDTLVATHASAGIWFVASEWAKASLRDGRRAPELKHCIPNAEQAVRSTPVKVQRIPVVDLGLAIAAAPPKPSMTGSRGDYEFTVERLNDIMQEQYDALSADPERVKKMSKVLHAKYPGYNVSQWAAFHREWRRRTGRFKFLPPLEPQSTATSTFQTLEETPLRVKTEPSRVEIPAQTTSRARVSITPSVNQGVSSSPSHPVAPRARMSTEVLAAAIADIHGPTNETSLPVIEMATRLHNSYPAYGELTWRIYIRDWRNGRDRFAPFGPSWDGRSLPDRTVRGEAELERELQEWADEVLSDSERHEDEMEETRATSTPSTTAELALGTSTGPGMTNGDGDGIFRGAYTDEEELAMCQFARAMKERDGALKWAVWNEFAQVYPHRRPGTWAEHYRLHKNRIDLLDGDDEDQNPKATSPVSPEPVIEAARPVRKAVQPTPNAEASSSTPRQSGSQSAVSTTATPKIAPAPNAEASLSSCAPKKKKKQYSVESSSRVSEPTPSAVISAASTPQLSKEPESLDKQHYDILAHYVVSNFPDDPPRRSADFAALGESHPRFKARSWRKIWRRDQHHPMLKSSLAHYRKALAIGNAAASGSGKKIQRNRYTEEDERKMAEFINDFVPSDRPARSSDWVVFQKTHKARTAASWAEHYRQCKLRIGEMVDSLRSSSFAEEMTSLTRHPNATAKCASGTASSAEVAGLGSDIEEEEEVEEIVPLRPTRRRGAGNEPIVIISDDDD